MTSVALMRIYKYVKKKKKAWQICPIVLLKQYQVIFIQTNHFKKYKLSPAYTIRIDFLSKIKLFIVNITNFSMGTQKYIMEMFRKDNRLVESLDELSLFNPHFIH